MTFGAELLRFPDLFPGRRGGEPWGERRVVLDVAGGPYRFEGLSDVQAEAVQARFGALCREDGDAAVASRVFRAPAADFREIDVRGWEYTLDLAPSPDSVLIAGLRLMARLDWTPDLAGGLWTPEAAGEEWTSVFENFLRIVTAYRLLAGGGVLLHSAGVTDGSGAFLLLGRSGAGKTTASRLCLAGGGGVLSDDLNAVLFDAEGPRVASVPFTGDLGERGAPPIVLPLRAVVRLVQGAEEGLRPLSPASALGALMAGSPSVNRDPFRREALFAVLDRLARSAPAFEVTFSLGGGLWDILRRIPP
ncbi:MAG: hypothetical protein ACJ75H_09760 [Thermoanaerobaculia bacterium]